MMLLLTLPQGLENKFKTCVVKTIPTYNSERYKHELNRNLLACDKCYHYDTWGSPRKEKNRKPPTGENVVPREQTIRVNPNRVKQGGIPEKESPGIVNPKGDPSGRQTELVPRCPHENSNEDLSWRKKELIPRHQRKRRGIPEKESPGIFTPKYNPSWRQKEINSKVPEG